MSRLIQTLFEKIDGLGFYDPLKLSSQRSFRAFRAPQQHGNMCDALAFTLEAPHQPVRLQKDQISADEALKPDFY